MIVRQKKEETEALIESLTESLSTLEQFGDSVLLSFDNERHLLSPGHTVPTRISFEVGAY